MRDLNPYWRSSMNVKFNGGRTLIFPNTFVDLPNGMLNWEWGPSTLQRLGKAQALRVYECALLDLCFTDFWVTPGVPRFWQFFSYVRSMIVGQKTLKVIFKKAVNQWFLVISLRTTTSWYLLYIIYMCMYVCIYIYTYYPSRKRSDYLCKIGSYGWSSWDTESKIKHI